jgi:hypothetical protein
LPSPSRPFRTGSVETRVFQGVICNINSAKTTYHNCNLDSRLFPGIILGKPKHYKGPYYGKHKN